MNNPKTHILFRVNNVIRTSLNSKDVKVAVFDSNSGEVERVVRKLNSWGNYSFVPSAEFRSGEYISEP